MRRLARLGGAVAAAWLAACAAETGGGPEVVAVAPDRAVAGVRTAVEIGGRFEPEVFHDFGDEGAAEVRARFAAALVASTDPALRVALEEVRLLDSGRLRAVVPAEVGQGVYDLIVEDSRGREGALRAGLRVVTGAESVAGFTFAGLGPQRVRVPFTVSITAVDARGRPVAGFGDFVTLAGRTGTLTPGRAGPFVSGILAVEVTVGEVAHAEAITVGDDHGHASVSRGFEVAAGLPAAVAFAEAPAQVAAGECARVEIELQDALGFPTPAEAPLEVEPLGGPSAFETFRDVRCAVADRTVRIEAGDSRAAFGLRSASAGRLVLHLAPAGLPGEARPFEVLAGAPQRLEFLTPARTVAPGACSPPVRVAALDEFGNAASLEAAGELILWSRPAGLAFFADAECRRQVGALPIGPGGAEASFHFLSQAEGIFAVEVAMPGSTLAPAAQEQRCTR